MVDKPKAYTAEEARTMFLEMDEAEEVAAPTLKGRKLDVGAEA